MSGISALLCGYHIPGAISLYPQTDWMQHHIQDPRAVVEVLYHKSKCQKGYHVISVMNLLAFREAIVEMATMYSCNGTRTPTSWRRNYQQDEDECQIFEWVVKNFNGVKKQLRSLDLTLSLLVNNELGLLRLFSHYSAKNRSHVPADEVGMTYLAFQSLFHEFEVFPALISISQLRRAFFDAIEVPITMLFVEVPESTGGGVEDATKTSKNRPQHNTSTTTTSLSCNIDGSPSIIPLEVIQKVIKNRLLSVLAFSEALIRVARTAFSSSSVQQNKQIIEWDVSGKKSQCSSYDGTSSLMTWMEQCKAAVTVSPNVPLFLLTNAGENRRKSRGAALEKQLRELRRQQLLHQ